MPDEEQLAAIPDEGETPDIIIVSSEQDKIAPGKKGRCVDLPFYHRFLKPLVAFDLKIGAFQPEHARAGWIST